MNFEFSNGLLTLKFSINESNKISLDYFGDTKNILLAPSTIVEAQILEANHVSNNPGKLCATYFGANSKYRSHSIKDNELIIVTEDEYLQIETHFILYDGVRGLSTYSVVKNISKNIVNLEYISSFYLYGLGQENDEIYKDMNVCYARNGWNSEAQWKEEAFNEVALFNCNKKVNLNRFGINSTGSWSTKEYLPMCGINNRKTKRFLLSQIENNGSWHIEIGDFANKYYFAVSGPEYLDNSFMKELKPNEKFISCQASTVLAFDFESAVQEITKLRRCLVCESDDHKLMPVIFNDFMHGTWDLSSEELIKPMVDVAKKVGVDTFVLDTGWFAEKSGWPDYIGEWKEYSDNFPNGGLKGMFDYIRSKGMKVGLWFEIENMGLKCPIVDNFSDDCFFRIDGKKVIHRNRYTFDFSNPKVYKWALKVICNAVEKYGLDYIKLDYNLDAGVGTENYSHSAGDGLLMHNRKIVEFLRDLTNKYPHLTIENCASGGQRLDYEMLKICPLQSSSDLEDYRKYPYIASNILGACVPETIGIWSYPVCNDNEKFEITNEVVAMNMVNSMLGRLHLSSKLFKLNDEQINLVKEGVELHKKLSSFKKESLPIFPKGFAKFFDEEVVAGLQNKNEIILNVWNTSSKKREVSVDLSKYNVESIEVIYPTTLKTNFVFDKSKEILSINFNEGYMGRTFKIITK